MIEISRKILCVDDEPNVLRGIERQLRKKHEITTAVEGPEGLEVLAKQGPFAVVVSDYKMPQMNGAEFLRRVKELSPDSVTVMLTGLTDLDVAISAVNRGHIFRFLNKPCPTELLDSTLNDCLEQYRLIVSERMLAEELRQTNIRLQVLNEGLERLVEKRTSVIQRLYGFVSALNGISDLKEMAELIVGTTAEVMKSNRVSLMLPENNGEYLTVAAARGMSDDVKQKVRVPIGAPIAGKVYSDSRSVVINDPEKFEQRSGRYEGELFASVPLASASLTAPDGAVGVLNVTERDDGLDYDEDALAALRAISEAAAIAIQNQLRLKERNESRDATIFALAKLAEHRDPETGAHLERVQIYCRLLCEALAQVPKYAMTIDNEFVETIVRSSPLHDIGKVGVPDNILLKPGRLTPEEFEIMKTHTTIGGDTIRALLEQGRTQNFLQMGMEIAYYHHEKYDGTGYPTGLAGEEIPLSARVLSVADVYDALTSKRVYKAAMPHDRAVAIIRADVGTRFDPAVIKAFAQRAEDFERIRGRLADQDSEPYRPAVDVDKIYRQLETAAQEA